ncbi:hypothetical protein LINGRAHAP2_LOCUS10188, partial [Linum grandiflorum]
FRSTSSCLLDKLHLIFSGTLICKFPEYRNTLTKFDLVTLKPRAQLCSRIINSAVHMFNHATVQEHRSFPRFCFPLCVAVSGLQNAIRQEVESVTATKVGDTAITNLFADWTNPDNAPYFDNQDF